MRARQAALTVVKTLRRAGYQALFAGGCVRDHLLGRRPKDYDVATDAHPEVVLRLFRRTLKVGAQFGVVMVLLDDRQVEVATFRTEEGYADGRRPDRVHFSDARQDALRRDFTINGMFFDPIAGQVIDFVDGRADLARRVIRTIGSPTQRFGEDYLRMLRAVRFAAQLDFTIEPATWAAMVAQATKIRGVSAERVAQELQGILTCPGRAMGWRHLVDAGLLAAWFGPVRTTAVAEQTLAHLRGTVSAALGWAAAWVDQPLAAALSLLETLKPSRDLLRRVEHLLRHRDVLLQRDLTQATLRRLLARDDFEDLMTLQRALQKARGESTGPLAAVRRRSRPWQGQSLPPPLLNGHDLMRLGARPGPGLGRLVEALYEAQLEERLHTAAEAEQWVRRRLAASDPETTG